MRTPRTFLLVAILVFPVRHLSAQGGSAVPKPKCDSPAHHQFDFWIGAWDVSNPDGHAGTNTVTLEENACLIHEHWKGAEGSSGQSFNYFDGADGKWHQVWVDANGLVLVLSGDYRDGRLAFTGERPAREGGEGFVRHKVTFIKNSDGTVRQLWEASRDGGATWRIVFDGQYRKREAR